MKYLGKTDSTYNICSKFSNVFTEEISKIKHKCNSKFLNRDSYTSQSNVSFRFRKVSACKVEKLIDDLQCNKAPGIDQIRVQDIKYVKCQISQILANFINMCAVKGVYPDTLKKSLIRPIYKQGSHLDYSNYRPIAILSVVNKIMEKVMMQQISEFLEHNKIISDTQHGFRKGRSTSTALAQFADDVNESLNSGMQVIALFIDFKKAFDTLDHDLLLRAMDECGIRGPVNQWFRSYLSNRTISTVIDGTRGSEAEVELGVPTGSVYGPVGYIMHVNSVSNVVENCKTYMYADDTCLLYSSKNLQTVIDKIQSDFENITKWAHDNGIIINLSKTKCVHIYSPYNKIARKIDKSDINILGHTYECLHNGKLTCKCNKIDFVDKYKYLGVYIDSHMSWKSHVNDVCNRLRTILGKFYHLSKILNRSTLYSVYYALADSLLNYGLSTYGRTFKTYLDQIKELQIRLLKYLVDKRTKNNCNNEYEKLFLLCKILPVHSKVNYCIAIEQYYCNDYKTLVVQNYFSRQKGKLYQPKHKNYYGQRIRKYLVPKIFNSIPLLKETKKLSKFVIKQKLKTIMLDLFKKELNDVGIL